MTSKSTLMLDCASFEYMFSGRGLILGDPGLRDGLGRQARAFAEGFSWDVSAQSVEAFLSRVVRRSRGG